jgi:hypothetical protein
MKRITIKITVLAFILALANLSCQKYLDAKSDQKLAVVSRLSDLQGLLDYFYTISVVDPAVAEGVSDNYYITDADYESQKDYVRNRYIWAPADIFNTATLGNNEWGQCYKCIYQANVVLANINQVPRTSSNAEDWNSLKGQAYFLRAHNFLMAASLWSLAYDEKSASTDLGVPLRLDPDINKPSIRASVQQTYDQIIDDLKLAIPLLPVTPLHVFRASRPAACTLLARTYLFMRKYDSCYKYTDLALQLKSGLLDYNLIPKDADFPFANFTFDDNPEIIYGNYAAEKQLLSDGKTDTLLYRSYDNNDLRKWCYFKDNGDGSHSYKGSYSGGIYMWGGIGTDELYLMRAECEARMGKVNLSMQDLNTLLIKRWKQGTFKPLKAATSEDALKIILKERRKELVMRNLRWMDIKRLNKEGANIVPKRVIDGQTYTLPPNDLRYALAVPEDAVNLNLFGIEQNPR